MNAPAVVTPSQEFSLYHADRPAWLTLVAPRMAARLRDMSPNKLADEWSQLPRDYQCAVWAVLDNITREAIRLARLPEIRTVSNCPMPEPELDLFGQVAGGVPA